MSESQGDEDSSGIQFASTQMQGRYEELKEELVEEEEKKLSILNLQRFKNTNDKSIYDGKRFSINTNRKEKITQEKTKNAKPNSKRRKIKSITSLMNDKYSLSTEEISQRTGESEEKVQLSILQYFSGKKRKINDILNRIETAETRKNNDTNSLKLAGPYEDRFIYSKTEWNEILRNIKVRFPNLSSKTKRSLKYLTRKVQSSQKLQENSIWSQTSMCPETDELNSEDINWLYDLPEDVGNVTSFSEIEESFQESNPFVLTLSQVMNETKRSFAEQDTDIEEDEDEHGSKEGLKDDINCEFKQDFKVDSQSFIENKSKSEVKTNEDDKYIEVISDSSPELAPLVLVKTPPKLQISETADRDFAPIISSHQQESMFSLDNIGSLPISGNKEAGTQNLPIELGSSSQIGEDNHEEIFSSSFSQENKNTPKKKMKPIVIEEIISSPVRSLPGVFKTPTKRAGITSKISKLEDSPIKLQQESPISESIYSTANTFFQNSISSVPGSQISRISSGQDLSIAIPKQSRKRYRTSLVEIPGAVEISELEIENAIKIRKIGTRREVPIDPEEEIADSEDEGQFEGDTSISIIEISRVIPDEDDAINKEKESTVDISNTSILQVPSSPREGDIMSDSVDLKEKPSIESRDFQSMNATQLREIFLDWGLKPTRGKDKMVEILNELTSHVNVTEVGLSQQVVESSVFEKITKVIRDNQYWYDKVLSYEPIVLGTLQTWLTESGIRIQRDILEKYCDYAGIVTTLAKDDK
ncbi:structure-specific endonuclease subunit Slx4p [[Candida] anglica]|uniref:Structure-specific endonuclease subunit SLX4 n=1 Tax=[Candida] anglica TaxID=148631 RepID=A0ABP0EE29_9ASCO